MAPSHFPTTKAGTFVLCLGCALTSEAQVARNYDALVDSTVVTARFDAGGKGFGAVLGGLSGAKALVGDLVLTYNFPGEVQKSPPQWVLGLIAVDKMNWKDAGVDLQPIPELPLVIDIDGSREEWKARLSKHEVNAGTNRMSSQVYMIGFTLPQLSRIARAKKVTGKLGTYGINIDSAGRSVIRAFLTDMMGATASKPPEPVTETTISASSSSSGPQAPSASPSRGEPNAARYVAGLLAQMAIDTVAASGNLLVALSLAEEAVRKDSALNQAYVARGLVKAQMGANQEALADYSRAIALGTDTPGIYYLRAVVRLKLGDNANGTLDMKEAARRGDTDAQGILKENGITW